jgi:hypothetical protein
MDLYEAGGVAMRCCGKYESQLVDAIEKERDDEVLRSESRDLKTRM